MSEEAVVVRANPARKVFRPQTKTLNKIPPDILENPTLNLAIRQLPSNYNFEVHKTVWRIKFLDAKRVALQMPEGLLMFSLRLANIIEEFTEAEVVIMGDVTYGACCVDDLTAKALRCDLLVHYGHSCLIPVDRMSDIKCLYIFVDIKIDSIHFLETVRLNFSKTDRLCFVSTIQFVTTLHAAAKELRTEGYQIIIPQTKPLSPGEILGCTAPSVPDVDALVYLGDGRFHLEAAMIANPNLKAYRYDPYEKKFTLETYDFDVMFGKRTTAIEDAKRAGTFGLILGTLGRQGSVNVLNNFKCRLKDKKFVQVLLSEIYPGKLALFSQVEAWIQVACPRLSIDWGSQFSRPILSPWEAAVVFGQTTVKKGPDVITSLPMDFYSGEPGGPWAPNYKKECCGKGCDKSKNV
uniref:2-(3-amino-3-carboxypropyl)histidine synthase subunit 1 n=2 Tax=Lygus hesperus TaxID=30085 RepID=A0A0A9Y073_LYGHE